MSLPILGYSIDMARVRIVALGAALMMLVGVRGAVAAPVESTAVLRAIACCATHCGSTAAETAARCCQIRRGASDPAGVAAPLPDRLTPAAGAVLTVADAREPVTTGRWLRAAAIQAHPPDPLYLRTLSLRL